MTGEFHSHPTSSPWPTTPPIPRGKIDPFPGFPTGSGGSYITDGHLYISNPAAPRPGLIRIAGSAGIRSAGNPETFPLRLMRRNYAILAAPCSSFIAETENPRAMEIGTYRSRARPSCSPPFSLFLSFPSLSFFFFFFFSRFERFNGLKLTVSHLSSLWIRSRKGDIESV